MRRAIFRSVLICLCIYATFSGFSTKSLAVDKVRGFVISSQSDSETMEKVNNRILNSTKGSANKISYVVNIEDKSNFTLAGLLSLDKDGVVVPIKNGIISEDSKNILKNSEKVYVIGDRSSVSDEVLSCLDINFERIGTDNNDVNLCVNKYLGNKDLLIVDVENDSDIIGAVNYAYMYDMNLYLFDSNKGIDENIILNDSNSEIYFFDGVNPLDYKLKSDIYTVAKKEKKDIERYSLDGSDLVKVFKDRYSSVEKENFVLSKNEDLTTMLSSYILAEKNDYGYLIIDKDSMNLDIEKLLRKSNAKKLIYISTEDLERYVNFRTLLMSLNNEESMGFEIKDDKGEIILSDLNPNEEEKNFASEKVELKSDEVLIDGKVVVKRDDSSNLEIVNNVQNTDSKKSDGINYSKVLNMVATSYTNDPKENGGYTTTYMGTNLRYGVVAVDPKVIPLGTKLYIEGYGYAVAEDIGGAIKGNRIDVCYTDKLEADKFGKKTVKVYILK